MIGHLVKQRLLYVRSHEQALLHEVLVQDCIPQKPIEFYFRLLHELVNDLRE